MINKPWKDNNLLPKKKLTEKLIPATWNRLEAEMKKRPELKRMLNTPLKDLDPRYMDILDPRTARYLKDAPLIRVLQLYMNQGQGTFFYSQTADNFLEGFASYMVNENNEVFSLSILSFDLTTPSIILMMDMKNLLLDLKKKYHKITFQSTDSQKALEAYKKITSKLGGTYSFNNALGYWVFTIPGDV